MRRVQSSLGMRRSSSFFWTPAAHQEFERALNTLNARGAEVSAASIMTFMGLHSDLKMSDIERHLKVPTHPGAPTPAAPVYPDTRSLPRHSCSVPPCAPCARLAAATSTYTIRLLPWQKKLLVQRRVWRSSTRRAPARSSAPAPRRNTPARPWVAIDRLPARSMAAVAEEPGPVESGGTPAAAVIATLTDQLDRQQQEHRQMVACASTCSFAEGAAVAT